jgi:hypothetical protein
MNNLSLSIPIVKTINHKDRKRSYWKALVTNQCPHCREGKIFTKGNAYDFKDNLKMHENCPICNQVTEIEVGFYYGTSYVSYILTVALSGFTFVAWCIFIGISVDDNRVFYWLGINSALVLLMQPLIMRFSRTLWLSWFVKYDPEWKENEVMQYERILK